MTQTKTMPEHYGENASKNTIDFINGRCFEAYFIYLMRHTNGSPSVVVNPHQLGGDLIDYSTDKRYEMKIDPRAGLDGAGGYVNTMVEIWANRKHDKPGWFCDYGGALLEGRQYPQFLTFYNWDTNRMYTYSFRKLFSIINSAVMIHKKNGKFYPCDDFLERGKELHWNGCKTVTNNSQTSLVLPTMDYIIGHNALLSIIEPEPICSWSLFHEKFWSAVKVRSSEDDQKIEACHLVKKCEDMKQAQSVNTIGDYKAEFTPVEYYKYPSAIISGGQTGADLGGLIGAELCGLMTGGYAPLGWKTENGPDESLKQYSMQEYHLGGYTPRTEANVISACGTVLFGDVESAGSKATIKFCQKNNKKFTVNPDAEHLADWCKHNKLHTLNVAGNRESKNPGVCTATASVIGEAFGDLEPKITIECMNSGKKTYLDVQEERQDKEPEMEIVVAEKEIIPQEDFVHLHVHSQFSLLDGVPDTDAIARRVHQLGQPAVALTDHGYMFGNYKFQKSCDEFEVKAIHGVEAYYTDTIEVGTGSVTYHLILLAMNKEGWKNLCRINTIAGKDGFYRKPRIDAKILSQYNEGILCTAACYASPVSFHIGDEGRDPALALQNLNLLKGIFGDRFYMEVMQIGWEPYDRIVPELIDLAQQNGVKTIVTNDAHYASPEDIEVKKLMMDISGWSYEAGELYLKTRKEIIVGPILPEFADNTLEVAERIDFNLNDMFNGYIFPTYDITGDRDYEAFTKGN